jgi:AraC family transcriptional regulator
MARREASSEVRPEVPAELVPLLVEVKQNLDRDLTLGTLAQDFGASPFHFHRLFSDAVGETPKQHVERMRIERAAYRLAVTDDSIIEVALDVGFRSPETFSRAFRRRLGCPPSAWRRTSRVLQRERLERNRDFRGDGCLISEVRFETRRPQPLLAIRRMGAYSSCDRQARAPLWAEIEGWALRRGIALGPERLGLFPDDPGLTPEPLQGADICIPIASAAEGDERVRCIELAGGAYGVIQHLGPPDTVGQAYRSLADGIRRSDFVFRPDPPVHVFVDDAVGGDPAVMRSELWFPVRRPWAVARNVKTSAPRGA